MMMDGMGMMPLGVLSMLLGLVILFCFILAGAYVVRRVWDQNRPSMAGAQESALDILRKRYAKGEISREEFERVKKDIA